MTESCRRLDKRIYKREKITITIDDLLTKETSADPSLLSIVYNRSVEDQQPS